jgi:hypothetical protein
MALEHYIVGSKDTIQSEILFEDCRQVLEYNIDLKELFDRLNFEVDQVRLM